MCVHSGVFVRVFEPSERLFLRSERELLCSSILGESCKGSCDDREALGEASVDSSEP